MTDNSVKTAGTLTRGTKQSGIYVKKVAEYTAQTGGGSRKLINADHLGVYNSLKSFRNSGKNAVDL